MMYLKYHFWYWEDTREDNVSPRLIARTRFIENSIGEIETEIFHNSLQPWVSENHVNNIS